MIRLLLLHGGDSRKKNKQQKTVYDYAEKNIEDYKRIEEAVRETMATMEQSKERERQVRVEEPKKKEPERGWEKDYRTAHYKENYK